MASATRGMGRGLSAILASSPVAADAEGRDPELRSLPVIVLSTSSAPPDIEYAYAKGANAYVRKPLGMDRLVEAAASIRDFWLGNATLPTQA